MILEEALRGVLLADTALAGLIGGRMYPERAPQGAARPLVVFELVSTGRDYTHEGDSGYRRQRVQFNAYAERYATARAVADAMADVLSGFCGHLGGLDISGIEVEGPRREGWNATTRTYGAAIDAVATFTAGS